MRSNGECDLHPREHPIVDRNLCLDEFQSFDHGILTSFESIKIFLELLFFAFLFQLVSRKQNFCDRTFFSGTEKNHPPKVQ